MLLFKYFNRSHIAKASKSLTTGAMLFVITQSCYAATADSSDKTWGVLYKTVHSLFTGTAATTVSLIALTIGIVMVLASSHKLGGAVTAIGVPILVQAGPAVLTGLSGTVI